MDFPFSYLNTPNSSHHITSPHIYPRFPENVKIRPSEKKLTYPYPSIHSSKRQSISKTPSSRFSYKIHVQTIHSFAKPPYIPTQSPIYRFHLLPTPIQSPFFFLLCTLCTSSLFSFTEIPARFNPPSKPKTSIFRPPPETPTSPPPTYYLSPLLLLQ